MVVVHTIADGNNADIALGKILKFGKSFTRSARETAQILDNKYIVFALHELFAHTHVIGALLEGIARFVTILEVIDRACRKVQTAVFAYNRLLVFDTRVIAVKLKVYGDSRVRGNAESFNHIDNHSFDILLITLYHRTRPLSMRYLQRHELLSFAVNFEINKARFAGLFR